MKTSSLLKIYVTPESNLEKFVTNENEFKKNVKKAKMPTWEPKLPKHINLNIFLANIQLDNPKHSVIFNQFAQVYRIWASEFTPDRIIASGFFGDVILVRYNDVNMVKKIVDPRQLGYAQIEEY